MQRPDGSIDPSAARETLESLAVELQSLPIASLAPALVLALAGIVLLLAGRRLLRPVLVVTSIVFGALLGAPLLGGLAPRIGTLGLTLVGGVLGLLLVAVAWRLMYGVALGLVLAFVAALVALIGVDAGLVDARRPTSGSEAALAAPGVDRAEARAAESSGLLDRTPETVRPLVAWAESRWSGEPAQVRSLLTAAAASGGFVGLVVGSLLPQSAAALLTSVVGGLFALLGGLPLLSRLLGTQDHALPPIAWLGAWLALALVGWLVQLPSPAADADAAAREATESARPDSDGTGSNGAGSPRRKRRGNP